jgi:hypothetical protein
MHPELSKSVDQLVGGEPYRLHRWKLPDDHPRAAGRRPNDLLTLTEDDELVLS